MPARNRVAATTLGLCLAASPAWAQAGWDVHGAAPASPETPNDTLANARSVTTVENGTDGAVAATSLALPLSSVPGAFVQDADNHAQDVRIQIRGFGTRAAFGIRGLRVFVDGLPETLPDGQTEIDALDASTINRIEIWRGPASSVHGNGAGGIIQIHTDPIPEDATVTAGFAATSFGTFRTDVSGGTRTGRTGFVLRSSLLSGDGYRNHSGVQRVRAAARVRHDWGAETHGQLHLDAVTTTFAQDPGGITRQQMVQDPRQARDRNVDYDAGEAVNQARLGVTFAHGAPRSRLSGYAYGLVRTFENLLPVPPALGDGAVTFSRLSPGAGLRYGASLPTRVGSQRLVIGIDSQLMRDHRRRFANDLGERGEQRSEQMEQVASVGPYIHVVTEYHWLQASAGIRHDTVLFDVDVDYPADGGSGQRAFHAISPTLNLGIAPTEWLSTWVGISSALQVPTTTELANPDGVGFNRNVVPQTSLQKEVGARVRIADRVSTSLSLFRIDLTNLLLPFESTTGRTYYRNASRARRDGAELSVDLELGWGFTLTNALSVMRAHFVDYDGADLLLPSYVGNREPGIPDWRTYHALVYQDDRGLSARLSFTAVSDIAVDDANSEFAGAYHSLDARVAYTANWAGYGITPFLALRNLTNQSYSGTLRLNALGGAFYEPAAGFNVFTGVRFHALP